MALTISGSLIKLVATLALVAACLAEHDPKPSSPLDRSLAKFQKGRLGMDQTQLQLAEEFCKRVGQGRMYKHSLHLGSYNRADLAHLNSYLYKLTILKETGDVDAAIEILRQAGGKSDADLEAAAGELVEELLVPACASFVDSLRSVFEGEDVKDAALAKEISERGKTEEVQNFIYGWADYHTCNLLVNGDRSLLIKRIPSRLDDQRRIAARREMRLKKAQ